ncbi:hypothetical protein [Gordonia sp. (in: high G+C Gram-positive bacteria)]|jgi:hypothetical protein|uniref:hypothetical protein n=1 Tax=Gordonia sp. (in: high G+C Gram-positive bacteria) TaxID=84139 RepID=UPI001E18E10B|nr:hypothetical protein [Gordonia sp. (in: high G+C Gram-positive bacteria)]MCB1293607.1 hypothetical protein [Gordonia sp. (in: high G+C Gram-positive bacteria)]HMS76417.1 hypothetical protein [Gordonia sp. (in: high G+C Gram-positive bacteria)]HQV16842.1 hypothetical protein [Gordonia sp. (in: high G+C Gram-positive bacteria)]
MKRLTISVPDEVAAKAQRAVDAGDADSVSGYFVQLAEAEPDWVQARAAVDDMIADTDGITDADRDAVRRELGLPSDVTGVA